jgi:hypothetical protein
VATFTRRRTKSQKMNTASFMGFGLLSPYKAYTGLLQHDGCDCIAPSCGVRRRRVEGDRDPCSIFWLPIQNLLWGEESKEGRRLPVSQPTSSIGRAG